MSSGTAKPRTRVSSFKIHFGPATVEGKLVPIRKAEDGAPKFSFVAPDGQPVMQQWVDSSNHVYERSELVKMAERPDGTKVMVSQESLYAARTESPMPKNIMNVTSHDSSALDSIWPSQHNSYILLPEIKNGKKVIVDPINTQWYDFLREAISNEKLAFLGQANIAGYEGLYLLTTWRGHLVLQRVHYPADLWEIGPAPRNSLNAATRKKARAMAEKLTEGFDPEIYQNETLSRVNEFIATTSGGKSTKSPTAISSGVKTFDIDAALAAFDV